MNGRNTYTGPTTDSTGTLAFGASQHLAELNVGAGADAVVVPGRATTLRMSKLSIAGEPGAWSGRLDLAAGAAVVDYDGSSTSPLQLIADQVRSGRNGAAGAWTGRGITSSIADASSIGVGYAESAFALGPDGGLFAGEVVDGSSILLRAARYGDANLDGVVGADDLLALRRNLGARGDRAVWQNGDFNYDGRVSASDLVMLRRNFGQAMPTVSPAAFAAQVTAVPEPGTAGVLLLLGVAAMRRRR